MAIVVVGAATTAVQLLASLIATLQSGYLHGHPSKTTGWVPGVRTACSQACMRSDYHTAETVVAAPTATTVVMTAPTARLP